VQLRAQAVGNECEQLGETMRWFASQKTDLRSAR